VHTTTPRAVVTLHDVGGTPSDWRMYPFRKVARVMNAMLGGGRRAYLKSLKREKS